MATTRIPLTGSARRLLLDSAPPLPQVRSIQVCLGMRGLGCIRVRTWFISRVTCFSSDFLAQGRVVLILKVRTTFGVWSHSQSPYHLSHNLARGRGLMITFLQFQPLQLSRLFVTLSRVVPFVVEGLRSRTTRRTCHSWRPLPIASGVCFWFRRHRGCTKCRAGGRVCTYGLCRKCLCTRFEHAIHVLVALCHYARHCCSAVLSLYDRLCSLLSALLSLARARVTRVFCIPFCFSLSICFFGR